MLTNLVAARAAHWEDPNGALEAAVSAEATGRRTHDDGLVVRALALQGTIALNRGDLRSALALATEADKRASEDGCARAELAALKAQLAFFSGSYADALSHAESAMAIADTFGDLALRLFIRRSACMVYGTVVVAGWADWLQDTLDLSLAAEDPWQEAISRNDLACWHQREGRLAEAEAEIARGIAVARRLERRHFALGILHSTRADIRLLASRPDSALADAGRAL